MMPTMVSLPERVTLRDWVALNWLGVGKVVEIGAFAGGSATALLQGMEASRHVGKLHVFDTFAFPKGGHEDTYRRLLSIPGDSFRKVFDAIMRDWQDRLEVVEGDASRHTWAGGPIELLHLDCSVSRDFHERVAIEFYPHLLPQATLVHQDFAYEKAPFIPEIMGRLSPWFKRLGRVETTVYFVLDKKITREDIEKALFVEDAKAA